MANPFTETLLDLGYDYGSTTRFRWKTSIVEHGNGTEQRNCEWSQPLGSWQVGDRSFYLEPGESLYLKDFFEARQGSYEGFRFKDWSDFQAVDSPIGVGNGVVSQFQLVKRYAVGAVNYNRLITKPIPGTVSVKVNGFPLSGLLWAVNSSNGLLSFSSPPVGTITASFEFHVPVQFSEDSCTIQLQAADAETGEQLWKISSLSVEEIWVTPGLWPSIGTMGTAPTVLCDLGIFRNANSELTENTTIVSTAKWRSVRSNWGAGKRKLTFDRMLDRSELSELQNYFWCCHGSHHSFPLKHNGETATARFLEDTFSTQFVAADDTDSLWQTNFRVLLFS